MELNDRELLSNSEIKTFRSCRAKHHYAYGLRMRPIKVDAALEFGTAWHALLERDLTQIDTLPVPPLADPYQEARLQAMWSAYQIHWSAAEWQVLGVEVPFEIEISNPLTNRVSRLYQLGGRIDAIARVDGKVYVVEHKTSGGDVTPGSKYWQRLRMDTQCSAYMIAARDMGHDIAGVIYNVAVKPALRPLEATPPEKLEYKKNGELYARCRLTAETPEEYGARCLAAIGEDPSAYFARRIVTRTDDEIATYRQDLWLEVKSLHEAKIAGSRQRNPDSCWQYERACDYYDVCCGVATIDDPALYQIRPRQVSAGGR